jgi:thiamine-monophosphate kinase
VPLSEAFPGTPIAAATAGDDYELLFAAPAGKAAAILALAEEIGLSFSRIGRFAAGAGLSLADRGTPVPLPARLGFEHG